jgi:hypothetical protein
MNQERMEKSEIAAGLIVVGVIVIQMLWKIGTWIFG